MYHLISRLIADVRDGARDVLVVYKASRGEIETVRVGELLVPRTLANYGTDDDGNECTY